MSKIYLKEYEEYSVIYDRSTVRECRMLEQSRLEELPLMANSKHSTENPSLKRVSDVAIKLKLQRLMGTRYEEKDTTIRKWMAEDKKKDEVLKRATPPNPVHCKKCKTKMKMEMRHIDHVYLFNEGDYRVWFFYKCLEGCLPNSIRYEDGSEHVFEPKACPECGSNLKHESMNKENGDWIDTERCIECGYVDVEEWKNLENELKKDTEFENDRSKYCMSEEEGQKYVQGKIQLEALLERYGKE